MASDLRMPPILKHAFRGRASILYGRLCTLPDMRGDFDLDTFGGRIEAALALANKKRKDLAAELKISPQALGQVISGQSKAMNAENAVRTARFLSVDPLWLTAGEGAPRQSASDDQVALVAQLVDDIAAVPAERRAEAIHAASDAVSAVHYGTNEKARTATGAVEKPNPERPQGPQTEPTEARKPKRSRTSP